MRDNTIAWLVEPQCRHLLRHRWMTVEFRPIQHHWSLGFDQDQTNGIWIRQVWGACNQEKWVDIFLQLFHSSLFHQCLSNKLRSLWFFGLADSAHDFLCESGTHSHHSRSMTRSLTHNQWKPVSTQDPSTFRFGPASRSKTYHCNIRTYEECVMWNKKYEAILNDHTSAWTKKWNRGHQEVYQLHPAWVNFFPARIDG
jgi:hypothetical protein